MERYRQPQRIHKNGLINCRQQTKISSLNVRTLRTDDKREELCHSFEKQGIAILGIQEHRVVHEDIPIRYEKILGSTLITTSAWKNRSNAAQGGVGLLVNSKALKSLKSIKSHTPRIIQANFSGNPNCSIVIVYAPTSQATDQELDDFYNALNQVIEATPAHTNVIIAGDFNAKIGKNHAKHTISEVTNRNGERLIDLAQQRELTVSNTSFQKRPGKLWTWIDPSGGKHQIDYMLTRRKWRNGVKNIEAYSTFSNVGSDHRILTMKFKLSLRANKNKTATKVNFDWKTFCSSSELQMQYTIEVKNRFEILDEENSASEHYKQFVLANQAAMEQVVPKRRNELKNNPITGDLRVQEARKIVKDKYQAYIEENTDGSRTELKHAKANLAAAFNTVKAEMLCDKLKDLQSAHENSKHCKSWKLIDEISNRKAKIKGQVEGNTQKERIDSWYSHFEKLLGENPTDANVEINIVPVLKAQKMNINPFNQAELQETKKTLTSGKSSGPDGIPSEIYKYCDLDDFVLYFCNKALMEGLKPMQWSTSYIVPVPKSGDLRITSNYRGISLTCIITKIYNKMILNRIRPYIDKHLRNNQNGFRAGRSTTSQILALRRIIEGIKNNQLPAIITFIDFRKAFDSINRTIMMKILSAYGIPQELVSAIAIIYEDMKAKVLTPDGETEWFNIHTGVMQGDTLSPYLFIIVLDYVLRQTTEGKEEELGFTLTPRKTRRVGPIMVTDLDFADDLAIISNHVDQAQAFLHQLEDAARTVGLIINDSKTKLMAFNQPNEFNLISKEGKKLDIVTEFKYLGSRMSSTEKDITARIQQAWRALHKLNNIWRSNCSLKLKRDTFVALVESILLYGCTTWTLTKKLEKRLDGTYTNMLRKAMNVLWSDRISNKSLYGPLPKLSDKIRCRRLQHAGHCYRHRVEEIAGEVLFWQPKHGKQKVGRPTKTYIDTLKDDINHEICDIKSLMEDKLAWKEVVETRRNQPK